jgi:precorrin-2 dehydrogenase/sirohydrochlorin ferrochelatase
VVRIVAPTITDSLEQLRGQGAIEWVPETFRPEHLDQARLVFAATNSPQVNLAVVEAAHGKNLLAHRADEGLEGDFVNPAVFQALGFQGTIQTEGVAPLAAAFLRHRLESYAKSHLEQPLAALLILRQRVRRSSLPSGERTALLREILPKLIQSMDRGTPPLEALLDFWPALAESLGLAQAQQEAQAITEMYSQALTPPSALADHSPSNLLPHARSSF